ncbi:hypothetical protein [Streptomyces exfoliatus]|uniref:hypothetical protein n=1 Tax=Streptomyces exfoliatus TaxID=1905 RepID=UPI003C2CE6B7
MGVLGVGAYAAGLPLDYQNHEPESFNTKDTLMNSFQSTSPTTDGISTFSSFESTAYEEMLDAMQAEIDVLQFAVQRRRKALRRQKRRARLARYGGTRVIAMTGLGAVLLAVGVTLLVLGFVPISIGFIDLALKIWCDAFLAARPPARV